MLVGKDTGFQGTQPGQVQSADLELAGHYDLLTKNLELFLTRKATVHDPDNCFRIRSIPGVGKILAMTMLDEIHDIDRFERVQNFASYARLAKCEKSSSGKRLGTSGAKIGNAHLKWAFSEAAVLFLRGNEPAQLYMDKLRKKAWQGQSSFCSRSRARPRRLLHDEEQEAFLHRSFSYGLTGASAVSPTSNWSQTRDKAPSMPTSRTVPYEDTRASWLFAPATNSVDWTRACFPTTILRSQARLQLCPSTDPVTNEHGRTRSRSYHQKVWK